MFLSPFFLVLISKWFAFIFKDFKLNILTYTLLSGNLQISIRVPILIFFFWDIGNNNFFPEFGSAFL